MPRFNAKPAIDNEDAIAPYATGTARGNKFGLDISIIDQRRGQTILFAVINAASSGANTIVGATAGKKIKVLNYSLVADAPVTVKWQSGVTDKSGAMSFGANGGISTPFGSPSSGWLLETDLSGALNLNLGAAVGVRGHLSYFLEE